MENLEMVLSIIANSILILTFLYVAICDRFDL